MTRPKNRRISLNIRGHSGQILAILSPYESTLCADDGSVLFSNLSRDVDMATK